MEKPATDIYSFEELRKNGFSYVDKTAQLLPLANLSIGKQFFLARPRRFGKSLLISTLHCLFAGRRDLFQGLAIEPKWDWSKMWPILHLDMGSCAADTIEEFRRQANEGRIDMTCETPAGIWLIEFKLDRPAEEALSQIDARNYAAKYDLAGKRIFKLGISFSSERRTIADVALDATGRNLADRTIKEA